MKQKERKRAKDKEKKGRKWKRMKENEREYLLKQLIECKFIQKKS